MKPSKVRLATVWTPCRVEGYRMYDIMKQITKSRHAMDEENSNTMARSGCTKLILLPGFGDLGMAALGML